MAVAQKSVAAMRGDSKENFLEMAKSAAQEYLHGEEEDDA
jgi:predicted RNase H-like HicB family nuclease